MYDGETVLKVASIYAQDLPNNDISFLKAELHVWRCLWRNKELKPDASINTLPPLHSCHTKHSDTFAMVCHTASYLRLSWTYVFNVETIKNKSTVNHVGRTTQWIGYCHLSI